MNHTDGNAGNVKEASKKICPRAARENAKKKSEVPLWKKEHTGLTFHFDRKKIVTHEMNFNSVSKTEKVIKVSETRTSDSPVKKQSNNKDTKKIKVLMDTLKISKSEDREKSPLRKEMPKSPVVERLTSKKACTRCSRCSRAPKEEKSEIKPLKISKKQDQPLKSVKKEIEAVKSVKLESQQSPKPCKKQCSKLSKLQEDTPVRPKSILKHAEKSTSGDEKNDIAKNHERKSNTEKTKSCSVADKENSSCTKEVKAEFAWPKSGIPEIVEITNSAALDKGKSEIVSGSELPAATDTKACVMMNGTRHDEHLCDPHIGLESPGGTKKELESVKGVSKIPRKTDSPVLKPDINLNKSAIPQPIISYELGYQNMKNQEVNIVNVVN